MSYKISRNSSNKILRFVSKYDTLRKYLDKKTLNYTQVQCHKSGDIRQLVCVWNVNNIRVKVGFVALLNEVFDVCEWDEIVEQ